MIIDGNNKEEFLDLDNNLHNVDGNAQMNGVKGGEGASPPHRIDEDAKSGNGNSDAQMNRVKGEEVGSGEDASPPDRRDEEAKGGNGDADIGQGVLKVSRQLNQGSSACWEKFLHVRSIKVLLVENDDSTRYVVTALLRNCNYEVMEVANGLDAWKILEDLTNHIDLVLSEVVMPCLSGVGLLGKIMSHKTRKNIPVIMMSSHNSMGLVFKCLSKGAVDFLVKPIRKNELRNLWQHVWRRYHSSSSSGSESGTHAQNSGQSKGSDRSDDENGSDDAEKGSMGMMKVGDGSDSGSGTKSSWTKQAVELEILHAVPTLNQVTKHPDRTCAQVICPTPLVSATLNFLEQGDHLENIAVRKEQGNCGTRSADLQFNCLVESSSKHSGRKLTCLNKMNSNIISKKVEKGVKNPNGDKVVLTGVSDPLVNNRRNAIPKELANTSDTNHKVDSDSTGPSAPGIILKRSRVVKDSGTAVQDQCADDDNDFDMGSSPNKVKVAEWTTRNVQGNQSNHILKDEPETPSNCDDLLFNKLMTGGTHCEPSNVKDGNYSMNRNASGSFHGSNDQNSSSIVANAGETNAIKIDVAAGKSGSGSSDNVDQNKAVLRETLLNRFRQKRKAEMLPEEERGWQNNRLVFGDNSQKPITQTVPRIAEQGSLNIRRIMRLLAINVDGENTDRKL